MTSRDDNEWQDEKWAVGGLLGLLLLGVVVLTFTSRDHSVIATVAPIETTGQSTR